MKFGCLVGIFLNSANLICQSTDISKCFRGFVRLRDKESRLYYKEADPNLCSDVQFSVISPLTTKERIGIQFKCHFHVICFLAKLKDDLMTYSLKIAKFICPL